jgi:ferritin-like metal-binding protein YciE
MALFAGNIDDLKALYTNQLRSLLSSEEQITEALPKMAEAATDSQLKQALQSHLQETEQHVDRLEQILGQIEGETSDKKCAVTAALISAGENIIKSTKDMAVRDAGIIASAQKVEHFEMASYGTARSWAETLGFNDQAAMLDKTLQEEGHADHLLTTISERMNPQASGRRAA